MGIKSGFAILDVTKGRKKLRKRFAGSDTVRIPVTITGYIDCIWGQDDGISQEFAVEVVEVEVGE